MRVELVRADGETAEVVVAADETVLEGAEAAGVSLPFGCRRGACGTCTAELLEGAVDYRRPPRALKDRHREAGYVLTCSAEPQSACRLRVGSDVVSELVDNPWRHGDQTRRPGARESSR